MEKFSDSTGISVMTISRFVMVIGVACVCLGIGQDYITIALSVAYPVFMSFLALESDGAEDDKQWLTYWVVFGAVYLIDVFFGVILHSIPFYFFFKLAFLLYLMHPSSKGASKFYDSYLLQIFAKVTTKWKISKVKVVKAPVISGSTDTNKRSRRVVHETSSDEDENNQKQPADGQSK